MLFPAMESESRTRCVRPSPSLSQSLQQRQGRRRWIEDDGPAMQGGRAKGVMEEGKARLARGQEIRDGHKRRLCCVCIRVSEGERGEERWAEEEDSERVCVVGRPALC